MKSLTEYINEAYVKEANESFSDVVLAWVTDRKLNVSPEEAEDIILSAFSGKDEDMYVLADKCDKNKIKFEDLVAFDNEYAKRISAEDRKKVGIKLQ